MLSNLAGFSDHQQARWLLRAGLKEFTDVDVFIAVVAVVVKQCACIDSL